MNFSLTNKNEKKIVIISSDYYPKIQKLLLIAATKQIKLLNFKYEIINVLGVFEIPTAISMHYQIHEDQSMLNTFSGYLTLGCVIRGETTHYDIVCEESASGIAKVSYEFNLPVILGVLTTENQEQALERAKSDRKDKGGDCARAAIEMANLTKYLQSSK